MDSICPIDKKCASEISALLQPPSSLQVQEYFDELLSARQCHDIKVKENTGSGKGVYAEMDFREEELVLRDQMLVGIQHASNKIDCLVCSYCFQFIGSIELQIGRKLYLQNLGVPVNHECDTETSSSHNVKDCSNSGSVDKEDKSYMKYSEKIGKCASGKSSSSKDFFLPKCFVESLMNGDLELPYSDKFPLPSVVQCPGGCGEAYYCSKSCADSDWGSFHSLLCTGQRSQSLSTEALSKFIEHAKETNDIFLLVAKAISFTILRYRKLKAAHLREKEKCNIQYVLESPNLSLLLEAWKPISVGYKRRWWDCVALPDDVEPSDEAAFRMEIRELAFTAVLLVLFPLFKRRSP